MKNKVINTIKKYKLIEKGDNVLVGVSGGPDSMALLYILYEIRDYINFNLYVAHVNHGVRGKEADRDEEFVKKVCSKLDIPFYSKKVDMEEFAKKNRLSQEEAGRKIRYSFFREIIKKLGKGKIAVAHNKNDQAETLLMRFIRGTGIDGLKGMDYINGDIIRPLLDVERKEIESFLENSGIKARIDKTNLKPIYKRNKIRLELIPYIRENFNENIINTLFRTSTIMKVESDFLENYSKKIQNEVLKNKGKNEVSIDRDKFLEQHIAIKNRILRNCIENIKGNLKGIEEKHISDMITLIKEGSTGKRIDLPNNLIIRISYDTIIIEKKKKSNKKKELYYTVKINGITEVEDFGFEISTKVLHKDDFKMESKNKFIKYFDYDKIKDNLYIRNRKPGDIFKPLGMRGRKKLKDFFIDEKIPREKRDLIPLLVDKENILWVIGYRISEQYKITNKTKRILVVEYKNNKEELHE
ncbi:tRNA lysidine(34) synthetase TilS [Thermohalobacter berrensis]|uniref:tRNA(Ile)-lysidine synthase n=1 Tax=Thermohalobacter berrensis TaxID=99594 RepID=A0A419T8U6_9FIRM|nr:tRNA lysidine(34) synthetase TilS [Thermohalobacter berrensis]RKD33883.1 tRNA lysidine(34) synthetase TilS [Thermohalobacter berrensis]